MGQQSSSISHSHHRHKRHGIHDTEDPLSRRQTVATDDLSSESEDVMTTTTTTVSSSLPSNNHLFSRIHRQDHRHQQQQPHQQPHGSMFQSMTSRPSPNHYATTTTDPKKKNKTMKKESPRNFTAVTQKNNETTTSGAGADTTRMKEEVVSDRGGGQQPQQRRGSNHHAAKHYSIGIGNAIHLRLKQKIDEHDDDEACDHHGENLEDDHLEMMIMTEEDIDEFDDDFNPMNDNNMNNNNNTDLRNYSVFTTTSTNSNATMNEAGKRSESAVTHLPSDDDFESFHGALPSSAAVLTQPQKQQPSNGSSNRNHVHSGQYHHHRRSSSIDYSAIGTTNVSSHGNHYQSKLKNTVETTTCSSTGSLNVASSDRVAAASISPPHHASELISTSLVHEMTFVEEEMDPKEERLWSENDDEISELWNAIPKSYHAGINRVYLKLKNRFKNDIDITDQQMRQMACDLGFPNFFYEYMFARLEPTVFGLLHEEYVLKKKKNRKNMRMERYANKPNFPPSNSGDSQEDKKSPSATPTNTTTIPITSKNSPQQQRIVEYKTLSSSPVLPRTELLNRLFNDADEVETKKPETVRLLSSFDEYINVNQDMKFEKAIKVKLIITEVGKSPGRIRTAASPLMSRLKVFDQFGWFHTSFSIGNLRFDWTNSGYCSVTTVKSATSLLAITCREIWSLRELEGILKLLSIEISRWNRNFTYTNLKGSVEKETGSCQTFTVEMMKAIGVADLTFVGNNSIHNFLRDLLQRGNPITKFSINEAFREKYFKLIDAKIEQVKIQNVVTSSELLLSHMPIIASYSTPTTSNDSTEASSDNSSDPTLQSFIQKQQVHFEAKKQKVAEIKRWEHFQSYYFGVNKKYIIFTTHRELDGFVHCLKELDENFKNTQEYGLLNAFDRGFWLRYSNSVSIMQRIQQRKKQRETVRSKLGFTDPLALTKEEQEEYVRIKRDLEICQPLVTGNDFNCAFGDPVSSRSLFIPSTKRSDVLDIQQDIQIGSLKL